MEVAQLLGLRVYERDLPIEELDEIFARDSIAVATKLDDAERRWAIAHGIGHCVMHQDANDLWLRAHTLLYDKSENQAEQFALHLLVDLEEGRAEGLETIQEIAEYFGVPVEMVRIQGRLM